MNQLANTTQNEVKDEEDFDDNNPYDHLCFNSKLILGMNKYNHPKRESIDSNPIKFSIDMSTAPKKRLHQYLNTDLLDELENDSSTIDEDKGEKQTKQNYPQMMQMHPQLQMINNNQITAQNEQMTQGLLNHLGRNKFDVSQSYKKNSSIKKKKPFEIREGDWTCFECHNLNFAFRLKCNRCGLFREVSDKKCEDFRNTKMFGMDNGVKYFMK